MSSFKREGGGRPRSGPIAGAAPSGTTQIRINPRRNHLTLTVQVILEIQKRCKSSLAAFEADFEPLCAFLVQPRRLSELIEVKAQLLQFSEDAPR
jgi:hypothetical protein